MAFITATPIPARHIHTRFVLTYSGTPKVGSFGNRSHVLSLSSTPAARMCAPAPSSSPSPAPTPPASPETPAVVASSETSAPPPATFYQAITQAQAACEAALAAGHRLLEVEFPPLPTSVLESSSVSAYDVSDANIGLALDFARAYAQSGKRVAIALPDLTEKRRAVELSDGAEEPADGVRYSALKDQSTLSVIERLWMKPDVELAVRDDDDIFVVLGASSQELPDLEALVAVSGDRPVICFNLKLDSARGDLGLPAFPRKDLHYRFLSKIIPVYYLRTRTYSRSIPQPPYVVNYSGALYRVFPGKYQVLLDSAGGRYRRLDEFDERPPLGQVRDCLTEGLNIEGVGGKTDGMMFRGYKSTTWWEDDRTKQASNNWRS